MNKKMAKRAKTDEKIIKSIYYKSENPKEQTEKTIRLIGEAIQKATFYPPIILHARKLAARARPKDYLGQIREIYDDFVKRWRYTYDPWGLETIASSPNALFKLVIAGDGIGLGEGRGAGDCDEAVAGIASLLQAVGFQARLVTTSPPSAPPDSAYTHIFPQVHVPKMGWITVDPVLYPFKDCGDIAPYSKIGFWNLNGKLFETIGGKPGFLGDVKESVMYANTYNLYDNIQTFPNYGLSGTDADYPDDWREMISGFGLYVDSMGYSDGADYNMLVETDPDETGLVRTPALEFAASDYEYLRHRGRPYHGMLALGDSGESYQWDQNLGFFKKLFRKARKKIKKVAKRFLKVIPGGKALMRIGKKILKTSMKLIKPLSKFVGKYAKYLAPVAALIPGVGPAAAAGLYAAGKVAQLMNKYGVKFAKGVKGLKSLKFKNPKQASAFQSALKREAAKQAAKNRSKRGRYRRPTKGRLLRGGTPEHAAYMLGMVE